MINIHKGCGASSSPSNPLISLNNKENKEGQEDGAVEGEICVYGWGMILRRQGHPSHSVGNEMKEKESRKGDVGCHIQGPYIPRRCKLSLELFFCGFISKCLFNIYGRVNKTSI